jgi:lactoylglutathione lyase
MKFCWSTLKVRDLEASLRFYQEVVGLKVDRRFKAGPGMEIVFLGEGETKIELIYDENSKDIDVGKDISWGFLVESIEEKMKLAKEMGVELQSGVIQPNPHVKFFYVLDPNGMKIQFVENI